MQTFLPYKDFVESAKCLDKQRMWKQCVEAKQILNTLEGKSEGWKNHPAVQMWSDNIELLKLYYNTFLEEAMNRGYKVKKLQKVEVGNIKFPFWFNDDRLFSSHRSNLLRKKPEYYSQFGWKEKDDLPYYWPIVSEN